MVKQDGADSRAGSLAGGETTDGRFRFSALVNERRQERRVSFKGALTEQDGCDLSRQGLRLLFGNQGERVRQLDLRALRQLDSLGCAHLAAALKEGMAGGCKTEVLLPIGPAYPHVARELLRFFVVTGLSWTHRRDDRLRCDVLVLSAASAL